MDTRTSAPRIPWNRRQATHRHFRWFRDLGDLHELTTTWIQEVGMDRSPHEMERGLNREVAESLWMLDTFPKADLDRLMDDSSPDDVLGRLERTVWAVQASTLTFLLDRSPTQQEGEIMQSVLKQAGWKLGRRCAETRWPMLPEAIRQNLKSLILTVRDTPMSRQPEEQGGLLIRRAVEHRVDFLLLSCAHRSHHPEILRVADPLGKIHLSWLRGFAYGLNPAIRVENHADGTNAAGSGCCCGQTWELLR